MKKILTFLAVALVSSAAYCIECKVGATSIVDQSLVGDKFLFFIVGMNGTDSADFIKTKLNAGEDVSSYAARPAADVILSGINGNASFAATTSGLIVDVGTYTSFLVYFNNNDISKATQYLYLGGLPTQTKEVGPITGNILFSTGNQKAFSANPENWKPYGTIPEPCSVALLAIGVAAFGLRRKVVK